MADTYAQLSPAQMAETIRGHLASAENVLFQARLNLKKFERQLERADTDEDRARFTAEIANRKREIAFAEIDVETMSEAFDEAVASLPEGDAGSTGNRAQRRSAARARPTS